MGFVNLLQLRFLTNILCININISFFLTKGVCMTGKVAKQHVWETLKKVLKNKETQNVQMKKNVFVYTLCINGQY